MKALNLLIALLLFITCKKVNPFKDDELTLKKTTYTGNQLKLNGYFFQDNSNLEWQQVHFFYRNGIVLESYVETKTGTLESVTNFSKSRWGVFTINSDTFSFEKC